MKLKLKLLLISFVIVMSIVFAVILTFTTGILWLFPVMIIVWIVALIEVLKED